MYVKYYQNGSKRVKTYYEDMVSNLMLSSGKSYGNRYLINILLTPDFGLYDNLGADKLGNHPQSMIESTTNYPDIPLLNKSISGEHRDEFLTAMGN